MSAPSQLMGKWRPRNRFQGWEEGLQPRLLITGGLITRIVLTGEEAAVGEKDSFLDRQDRG